MQEMSSRNVFFCEKNSLEFLFEGEEFFIGAILPYFCSRLFIGLDKHIEQMAHSLPYAIRSS